MCDFEQLSVVKITSGNFPRINWGETKQISFQIDFIQLQINSPAPHSLIVFQCGVQYVNYCNYQKSIDQWHTDQMSGSLINHNFTGPGFTTVARQCQTAENLLADRRLYILLSKIFCLRRRLMLLRRIPKRAQSIISVSRPPRRLVFIPKFNFQ